jgi:hypothetical protein
MKLTFGAKVNMQSLPSSPPYTIIRQCPINPLNAELNPICHLLTLLATHHILHISRIRVKHRYFCNFLGCMSLFKCRLVEYILHMRVNAK